MVGKKVVGEKLYTCSVPPVKVEKNTTTNTIAFGAADCSSYLATIIGVSHHWLQNNAV